ncbi:MAG: helix-turn-helix domain-containing protein [Ktedonobacteraceae bacterium]
MVPINTSQKVYHYKQAVVNGITLLLCAKNGERSMIRLRVKEIAEQRGMSRTKLSRLSDTNYKTVDMIWKNPYKEVGTTTLERLAKALGVRVVDLIDETNND